jgi:hypothetical protein
MDRYCDVCSGYSNSGNILKELEKAALAHWFAKFGDRICRTASGVLPKLLYPGEGGAGLSGAPSKPDLGLLGAEACGKAGEEIGFSR